MPDTFAKTFCMKYTAYIMALVLLAGCQPARVALPAPEWNQREEWTVKGRQGLLINQKLRFAEYRTESVKRSWTKGSEQFAGWAWGRPGYDDYSRIIGVEYSQRRQTVRFNLTNDRQQESSAFCVSRVRSSNFVLGKNPNSLFNIGLDILGLGDAGESLYWVKIYLKNDEQPWELLLDNEAAQRNSRQYTGIIARSRDEYLTIHPVYQLEGKGGKVYSLPIGSVGYEIRNRQGRPLAAVSLIDQGRVFMNTNDPDLRFLLANICTALLLQEQIG